MMCIGALVGCNINSVLRNSMKFHYCILHTNQCTSIYNKILVSNVRIKTLKNTPTCFNLIQIIFRELIYSLLKSQIFKIC